MADNTSIPRDVIDPEIVVDMPDPKVREHLITGTSGFGAIFGGLAMLVAGPVIGIVGITQAVSESELESGASYGVPIALVVVAQVGALAGAGGWMPFAAPALWAMSNGTAVTAGQLGVTLAVPLVFVVLSCTAWSRLQLDR